MDLSIEHHSAQVGVTVLKIRGDVDGSNYKELIAKGKELYAQGMRHMIVDLSECQYMSSSGLIALHTILSILRGESDENMGPWDSVRAIEQDQQRGAQTFLMLLNPAPRVVRVLELTGVKKFLPIYATLESALAAM